MARPMLHNLAERLGILPAYTNMVTRRLQSTSDDTCVTLLAAMGYDGSTEEGARRVLDGLEEAARRRLLPPVRVVRSPAGDAPTDDRAPGSTPTPSTGDANASPRRVSTDLCSLRMTVPPEAADTVEWHIELRRENGQIASAGGRATVNGTERSIPISLPATPELGYHDVRLWLRSGAGEWHGRQRLIVAPPRCPTPPEVLGSRRCFGVCANLYTVRSDRNWGVGDLGDLGRLCEWCAALGGAFVGVNPLHALRNVEPDISPYGPITRLYRNAIYIDISEVPELPDCAPARAWIESDEGRHTLDALRSGSHVRYGPVMAAKVTVLKHLYTTFMERHVRDHTARGDAYHTYCRREGDELTRFATFMALADHFGAPGAPSANWRVWPPAYRCADSPAVADFAREHAAEVDFHRYTQFVLDEQLGTVAVRARQGGLAVGLYQDLAVGSSPDGSDTWSRPDLFAERVNIGAPPDDYSATGQDWGLPPLNPHRLADSGYDYWIRLVRNALAHSGALRIDHVMGLTRQFWVPWGETALNGAYVKYPADDLAGILALESRRHHALVIGEDLGTVPAGFSEWLAARGILSCRVLYFEREDDGSFRPAAEHSDRALVTTTTHDHVPLAGFWQGTDIPLRHALGFIQNEAELAAAWEQRRAEIHSLCRRLVDEGLLDGETGHESYDEFCAAVHAFLARTPAPLVGLMLDDLTGETEPVNVPGTPPRAGDRHRNWSRRMRLTVDQLRTDSAVRRRLDDVPTRKGGS